MLPRFEPYKEQSQFTKEERHRLRADGQGTVLITESGRQLRFSARGLSYLFAPKKEKGEKKTTTEIISTEIDVGFLVASTERLRCLPCAKDPEAGAKAEDPPRTRGRTQH